MCLSPIRYKCLLYSLLSPHLFASSCHLLSAQQQLREELSQTQQVIHSYHSLGEEFTVLTQQYRQLREEIENRQWALTELGKPPRATGGSNTSN